MTTSNFLNEAKTKENLFFQVQAELLLGQVYQMSNDNANSAMHFLEGIRLSDQSNNKELDSTKIILYNNIGAIFCKYNHFELATHFYSKSLKLTQQIKDSLSTLLQYTYLINIQIRQKAFDKALNNIDTIFNFYNTNDSIGIVLNKLQGDAFIGNGQTEKAIRAYMNALKYSSAVSPINYCESANNLANIQLSLNQISDALKFNDIAFNTLKLVENNKEQLELSLIRTRHIIYKQLNQPIEVEIQLLRGIQIIEKITADRDQLALYKDLGDFYESNKKFELSSKYRGIYTNKLAEYILNQEIINEVDKKQSIELLTQNYFNDVKKNHEVESTKRNIIIFSSIMIFFLIMTVSYLTYEKIKIRKNLKTKLLEIENESDI